MKVQEDALKNLHEAQKQTQETERRIQSIENELQAARKQVEARENEKKELQERVQALTNGRELLQYAFDSNRRRIEQMYSHTEQYAKGLESMVNEMRKTKSYRLGRAVRVLNTVLKTKNVGIYISYMSAVVKRLFGNRREIDKFAIPMDHADQLIVYSRQFANTVMANRTDGEMIANFDNALCDRLIDRIRAEKRRNNGAICVMAPIFNSENIRDGYYRRIKAIDDLMGENTLRIYMSWFGADYESGALHVQEYDAHHIHLSYISGNERHNRILLQIAKEAGMVYHHSVGYSNEGINRCRRVKKIFDLHGALPEELVMYGNYPQSVIESKNERLAVEYGDALVAVTRSMKTHINRKYHGFNPRFIFLPILDDVVISSNTENEKKEYVHGKPIVVYAGG